MIFRYMASDNLDLVGVTDFSYEVAESIANTARQDGFMVFSGPDEMVFAIEDGVAGFAIQFHSYTLPS